MTQKEYAKQAFEECCNENTTVKRGFRGGFPFWNVEAQQFMYVPAFHFKGIRGIEKYRYTAVDEKGGVHSFEASDCCELLTPIWKDIPEGLVTLTVTALNNDGSDYALCGARTFYRLATFPETSPKPSVSYKESAIKGYEYAMTQPFIQHMLKYGVPDPSYDLNVYPSKMTHSLVKAMISLANIYPERREEALKIAENAADYVIGITPRGDDPLANLPPTYSLAFCPDPVRYGIDTPNYHVANARKETTMLIYPANMGAAYVELEKATGKKKYLDEALKIAEYFKKNICENGSWPLVLSCKTGKPLSKNYLAPLESATPFMLSLYERTGDSCWKEIAEKTIQYVKDNQLSVYNWEGQFEDSPLSTNYSNLSNFVPVYLSKYFCQYEKDKPESIETAKELMRFAEDQFVVWGRPAPFRQGTPDGSEPYDTSIWHTPAAFEQYNWYVPIDSSTATVADGFLSLYEAGCGNLNLAKARVLADQIVIMQHEDGKIPTHWMNTPDAEQNFWWNCMFHSLRFLEEISKYDNAEI